MNLIFVGPPGAGKGTHAQQLSQELNIPQISTGEILRKAMREKTPTGIEAQKYVDRGELVPDEVVIAIVKERLADDDCKNGYILDGFPRTIDQAKALDTFAQIEGVVSFELPDDVIVNRLSGRRSCAVCGFTGHVDMLQDPDTCPNCGEKLIRRKDDEPETITNRLAVYTASTAPLISYYKEKGLLRSVDCNDHTIEENHKLVRSVLGIE